MIGFFYVFPEFFLNEEEVLTMRIRLRSRKTNNSCYPNEAQRAYHSPFLSSGSAYIYEDIHVSVAHLAF